MPAKSARVGKSRHTDVAFDQEMDFNTTSQFGLKTSLLICRKFTLNVLFTKTNEISELPHLSLVCSPEL